MRAQNWTDIARNPGFWIACSMIFLVNSFFSVAAGYWLLAVLQLGTGLLALASAIGTLRARPRPADRAPEGGRLHDVDD